MKTIALIFSILVAPIYLRAATSTGPQETREVTRNIKIKESTEVLISNKFGQVNISTWDKNEFDIVIEIEVDHRSERKRSELMEAISIEIDDDPSNGDISFITNIGRNMDGGEFHIDYTIKMPAKNPLEIKLKFGELVLSDYDGPLEIDQSFGKMQVGDLAHENVEIKQSYGGGQIGDVNNAELNISFASGFFAVGNANELEITAKYSKLEIESASDVEIDCGFGGLEIGEVSRIEGEISYSGVEIGEVTDAAELELAFSSGFEIKKIRKGFKLIDIEAKYTNVDLYFEEDAGYEIDLEVGYGGFSYDEDDFNFASIKEESNSKEYTGRTVAAGNGRVILSSRFGGLKIKNSR